jgi:hypothetical protein
VIYEFPDKDQPIRQGDIFAHIPRTEISLGSIALLRESGAEEAQWSDLANESDAMTVSLAGI